MTDKNRNSHRIGKQRVEIALGGQQKKDYNQGFKSSGCKDHREFIMLLVERYNKGLLEG
ncbi:hypothetical protein JCM19235_1975 [Vibrio maritimus]|uniref:Uncharacterized protein n=1 Tax=Vibrio maritimus TaxID=990268 RepID=A0A090SGG0_9VIBR|nr:hypothetical protein JCM19235_1975 [Vibrio maritimus]